jgi:hypothetical protein
MVVNIPAFNTLEKLSRYTQVLLKTLVCLLWHHSPAVAVLTPACNVWVGHSPFAFLFSAALGVCLEYLNLT